MWEPVQTPYINDAADVSLPTPEEIRACSNVLYERHEGKIVALNDHAVAKFGRAIDPLEGQALIYLEQYVPDVPAPRLYAMYYDSNQLFLVMQRAPGVPLDQLWESLTDGEKESIIAQLGHIFDCLRKAKCPWPDFFGGLDGGSVHHYLFFNQKGDPKFLGPFRNEAALVKGLTDNFRAIKERNGHPDSIVRFYETHLGSVLRSHSPVLTHGDVHRKNIIVAENRSCSPDRGERSFDVVLVDWEMAGWLPDFWEYFGASLTFRLAGWDDDWCWRTGNFLPVWLAETAVMSMLDKDMGP